MGRRSRGVNHAAQMSRDAGGSKDSQKHRRLHWSEFSRFAARVGHTLEAVDQAEDWMLEYFVWFLVAGAMKPGTLANYRASLSVIQGTAGQDVSRSTRSRDLQLERRDRHGRHRARTPQEFSDLLAAAQAFDSSVVHVIRLMRWLGLRMREALMCGKSLETWRDLILQGDRRLPVERGAKNGRPRRTEVLADHIDETLDAINAALAFCRDRDFELVSGCHDDLKSAKSRLKSRFEQLPMRRELASHSLRFTYAVDFANAALDRGVSPVDVLSQLSDRLGHGPSRVKMILEVYCWQIRHRFPEKIHLPSDFVPRKQTKDAALSATSRPEDRSASHEPADRRRRPARGRRFQTSHGGKRPRQKFF
ncbi:integrase domain-containing protein [Paraburkholderia sp. CNPSo 3281]|uniref:integrase domain-containing protein n=1 Tax=Paraburkholderia sp. CNPSo 3281 TaxID=2940933 RepID=UPI0020B8C5F1|nr:integrase domain-containing protein [Paraburkholderia sp. CNPSo 3281]MCP3720377.1 integrase domain-containing protein [Paraburkholderia sp. CNPSo 3281]